MCRNIRTLFNFEPPATADEIHAAAVQFVRKVSGSTRPARANQAAFDAAVTDVSAAVHRLLGEWVNHGPPKDRDVEAARAKARSAKRFVRVMGVGE